MPAGATSPDHGGADGVAGGARLLAGPPGTRFTEIRWFDELASTNAYVADAARAGAEEGLVVVADHQTEGRGRLGRRWVAPAGANLLASVLLRPPLEPVARHLAPAVVALATADACAAVAGVSPGIKWPNDLLDADGRKLAGVLAEVDLAGGGPQAADMAAAAAAAVAVAVVVGVGLNVGWPRLGDTVPPDIAGRAVSLSELAGGPVDRAAVLQHLLASLERRVADLSQGRGRARQATELSDRCVTLGRSVRVTVAGDGEIRGVAVGISPDGHLVVDVAGARREVVAGDVVHVRDDVR